ncbi:MAG: hypothetical protein LCH52_04425 [Bacteroidetes bacterium]|nr:hypothetical protein [Bacteroidota bacterium]
MDFFAEIHPKAVHYPVALLSIYPLLLIIYNFYKNEVLAKSSLLMLAGGIAGVVFALFTGNSAFQSFVQANSSHPQIKMITELIEVHEDFATALTFVFSAAFVLNFLFFVKMYIKKETDSKFVVNAPRILLALSALGLYFLYKTAEIGGKLVFDYGVGTKNFHVN